jgi:hypothetical protein
MDKRNQFKEQYDILLKNGELLDMFPHFSKKWEKDKDEFISSWEESNRITDDLDIDFDEY